MDLKNAMDIIYGEQLHRLQPRTADAIRDLQEERLKKTETDIVRMSKENTAFLGTNFEEPLDENADIRFAHLLFVNRASKALGVAPYIHSKMDGNSEYKESMGRIAADAHRSTVYHELMHAFTDEAVTVDVKKGKYRLALPSDANWKDDKFGGLAVDRNAQELPEELQDEAEEAIGRALKNELKNLSRF